MLDIIYDRLPAIIIVICVLWIAIRVWWCISMLRYVRMIRDIETVLFNRCRESESEAYRRSLERRR